MESSRKFIENSAILYKNCFLVPTLLTPELKPVEKQGPQQNTLIPNENPKVKCASPWGQMQSPQAKRTLRAAVSKDNLKPGEAAASTFIVTLTCNSDREQPEALSMGGSLRSDLRVRVTGEGQPLS